MVTKPHGVELLASLLLSAAALSISAPISGCDEQGDVARRRPEAETNNEPPNNPPPPTPVARRDEQANEGPSSPAARVRPGRSPSRTRSPARSSSVLRPKDPVEKRILGVLEEMRREQSLGMMNVPRRDGRLLRLLAESIDAKRVVEIGTSNGYSSIWIALALERTGGHLTTLEINERRASLARKNFRKAGVSGSITLIMGDAKKTLDRVVRKKSPPIDMVFMDADKAGYVTYLEKLLPLVRPGGLVVAHNMGMRRRGIRRYLARVRNDPKLETLLFHMDGAGIGVTMKKR